MTRFCPSCRGDVETNDGHCLLGHPIALSSSEGSLAELRAEVDKAFDEAHVEMSELLPASGPPPMRPREMASVGGRRPSPPAPPPPPAGSTDLNDPIAAFAPPPRMDWGPKGSFLRRRPRRR